MIQHETRESWLTAAAERILPMIADVDVERDAIPAVRVSVGWPGGRGNKARVIGQAWAAAASEDGVAEVFISPVLSRKDPVVVLATLAHELCHVVDRNENGHRGRFTKLAKGIGLEGKMTATTAGADLAEVLREIAGALGEYPHGALLGERDGKESHPKQTTRMIKCECPCCGYVIRTTSKWLAVGTPKCPGGTEMLVA